MYKIGIDVGGTFTDLVVAKEGEPPRYFKTPSTPHDPSDGVMAALQDAAAGCEVSLQGFLDATELVIHGTTVATNTLVERKGAKVGLLTTEGFRDALEMREGLKEDRYNLRMKMVEPLVPRYLRLGVPERVRWDGTVETPLDEEALDRALEQLEQEGVEALAVCFLFSYLNPSHEQRVAEKIHERFPGLYTSLSQEVLPQIKEFDRLSTTVVNSYVGPVFGEYLRRLQERLAALSGERADGPSLRREVLIMQSNGGVVSNRAAGDKPVTMLLSGPAAGVLGAAFMSGLAGFDDILTLDVGGTSTDVSLVENLEPQLTSNSLIENYPVKTPMLDIATVASGGGSLAWVDDYGALKVGPKSAGAEPGPICYGRGGSEPTVTDAALVLGRLPHALVGGEIELDVEAARRAYQRLGERFDMKAEEAAAGVMEIAAANQVHGIRQVSVMKGREPGLYALVAFGGAGGLFAAEVADFLNIRTVLSPPNPGNLSAFGLHVSDIKRDYIRTLVRQQSSAKSAEIEAAWGELEALGRREIAAEGVAEDAIQVARSADVRYVGEGHEVSVAVPPELAADAAVLHVWSEFHNVHMRTFGFAYEGSQDVELVNLRIQATGRIHRPRVPPPDPGAGAPAAIAQRPVYWRGQGWDECDIFRREKLSPGHLMNGPLIVEEYGSTTVVPHGWCVGADAHGNLKLEKLT